MIMMHLLGHVSFYTWISALLFFFEMIFMNLMRQYQANKEYVETGIINK
jgi:hypothetical protein